MRYTTGIIAIFGAVLVAGLARAEPNYSVVVAKPTVVVEDKSAHPRPSIDGEVFLGSYYTVTFHVEKIISGNPGAKVFTETLPASGANYFRNSEFYLVLEAGTRHLAKYGKISTAICMYESDSDILHLLDVMPYRTLNETSNTQEKPQRCMFLPN